MARLCAACLLQKNWPPKKPSTMAIWPRASKPRHQATHKSRPRSRSQPPRKRRNTTRRADLPAVELGDGGHYALEFVVAQFGEDRQRQRISRSGFRLRQVSRLVSQIGEALLQMQRRRIVDFVADSAVGEEGPQFIVVEDAHYELVIDVIRLGTGLEQADRSMGVHAQRTGLHQSGIAE